MSNVAVIALVDQAIAEAGLELDMLRKGLIELSRLRGPEQAFADWVSFLQTRSAAELSVLLLVSIRQSL